MNVCSVSPRDNGTGTVTGEICASGYAVGQRPWLRDTLKSGKQDDDKEDIASLPACAHAALGGTTAASQG